MKREEAKVILIALKKVEGIPKEKLLYTEQHEDLFLVEHLLSQEAKCEFVSNMHIGRSRNDMGCNDVSHEFTAICIAVNGTSFIAARKYAGARR